MRHDELIARIGALARSTPRSTVECLCLALDELSAASTPEERRAVARAVAHPTARQASSALLECWAARCPEVTPAALACGLRSAALVDEQHRDEIRLELVWTGPATAEMRVRRTEQVLLELVQTARSSLLLVTYVAFDIARVEDALVDARRRGVPVRLVIETPDSSGGKLSMAATASLQRVIAEGATVYNWPLAKRTSQDDHHGLLHVKCCVADGRRALISSANLTGHALNLNMELGVLVSGGGLPGDTVRHFERLVAAGVLVELTAH